VPVRPAAAFVAIVALLGVSLVCSGSEAGARTVVGRPVTLRWLQMVDAARGYALGGGSDTYRVLRTVDGGRSWLDVTPGRGTYRATSPITIVGKMLLFSTRVRNGRFAVERSNDGGRTWKQSLPFRDRRGSPAPGQPFSIDGSHLYLAVNEGAAAGSSGQALFTSSDGGHSWRFVSGTQNGSNPNATQLPFGCDKDGFGFATPRRGFAGGYCAGGLPFFYRTEDGGRTWRRQLLPVPQQCACETTAPTFFSPTVGLLSVYGFGVNGSGKPYLRVLWTHDGGTHWYGSSPRIGRASRPAVVDATNIWVAGQAPGTLRAPFNRLYHTEDAGAHWVVTRLPFNAQNYQLDPLNSQTIFALEIVLGTRSIAVTRDGGRNWQTIKPVLVR
jgi:photosystem II stability/assembly factor-like uncharacterized protein